MCKDDIPTIDLKDNKLLQLNIDKRFAADFDASEFNNFAPKEFELKHPKILPQVSLFSFTPKKSSYFLHNANATKSPYLMYSDGGRWNFMKMKHLHAAGRSGWMHYQCGKRMDFIVRCGQLYELPWAGEELGLM
jgi:hypothetical protein